MHNCRAACWALKLSVVGLHIHDELWLIMLAAKGYEIARTG